MDHTAFCFCKNVAYIRQIKKLSQKQMAQILGVSLSTLRKIENQEPTVRINGRMICCVCDAFELSADGLLREDMAEKEGRR